MKPVQDDFLARKIRIAYDVTTNCDDGNVHVICKNRNDADEVYKHFGNVRVWDGTQEGEVIVWMNGEIVHGND